MEREVKSRTIEGSTQMPTELEPDVAANDFEMPAPVGTAPGGGRGRRGALGALVHRVLNRKGYENEQILLDTIEDLRQCRSEQELSGEIGRAIDQALSPDFLHIFWRRQERFRLSFSLDRQVEPKVLLARDFAFPLALGPGREPRAVSTLSDLSPDERRWLRSWGCRWLIPSSSRTDTHRPVGLVLLGQPTKAFTEVQKDLLSTLTSVAGSAWMGIVRTEQERLSGEQGIGGWLKECPECQRCFDSDVFFCDVDDSPLDPTVLLDRLVSGRYLLESKQGHGGMGAVYKAQVKNGPGEGSTVAVKVLAGGDQVALGRFANEAHAGRVLRHRNITQVLDQGQLGAEGAFMVMEYVAGRTLRETLDAEMPIEPRRVARWFDQILSAVHYAHSEGVIHRDLKPDNIMLVSGPDGEVAKVLDFGLAKLRNQGSGAHSTLTAVGMVIGTLSYMSPEQLAAESDLIDHRTDQFALGVMVSEALTGRLPFFAQNLGEMLRAVAVQPYRLDVSSSEQAQVANILGKALAKAPKNRHADVDTFRRELIPALEACERFRSA